MAETKKFTIIEYNEDTLVVELRTKRAPEIVGGLSFTHGATAADLADAAEVTSFGEDDQGPLYKLLDALGWKYTPLPRWQHDLIVAAMRCQMRRDDFTDKHRSLGDWFMAAAVHQADLLPPQLTGPPFSEPGCLFGGASGQAHNDMLACRLANCYGWLPEDGTLYHEFTEASAGGYVEEALAYLNANCCARDVFLDWVEGDLMVLTKQEEELPF